MKINTKYNEGDCVFFIENRKVCQSVVRGMKVEVMKGKTTIVYLCNANPENNVYLKVEEDIAYPSKEELLKSL